MPIDVIHAEASEHRKFRARVPVDLGVQLVAAHTAVALAAGTQKIVAQPKFPYAGLVGIRPATGVNQGLHARVNPRCGNDIARECAPTTTTSSTAQRIVDWGWRGRKVARFHGGRWNLR